MTGSPASGERAALRGYRSQYDHIAALVYDALVDDDLVQLRLTDPEAGRVDDLVLVLRSGAHGYQFKSSDDPAAVTFGRLLAPGKTRSGGPAPSLLRSLSDGWLALAGRFGGAQVHLVTDEHPSVNDRLGDAPPEAPGPRHFSAFLSRALVPIRTGRLALSEAQPAWPVPFARMRTETALGEGDFVRFTESLHLDLGARSPLIGQGELRRGDVIALSEALFRLVSESSAVVELDRDDILGLVGWTDRPLLRSRHDFPVDADTYTPLADAIGELDQRLAGTTTGYLAIVGPPGSGKSTLLSQALTGRSDRVVRYYAYVPGSAGSRTRMSSQGFLHDLVLLLRSSGPDRPRRELVSPDVAGLRRQLAEQLDAAAVDYRAGGPRTIVVVDGLDHVERDHKAAGSLLEELPEPGGLPAGVVFVVGARSLSPVPSRAKAQIIERGGAVDLRGHRLSASAVTGLCRRSPVAASLPPEIHSRIADVSGGYPLAVGYLLNRLRDAAGEDGAAVVDSVPPYAGDVAQEYRAVWDGVGDDPRLIRLLGVLSRLRVGVTTEWLQSWNEPETLHAWRTRLQYLFRQTHDGWRFFHDSFRQFAADRTAESPLGDADDAADAAWHAVAADLCGRGNDPAMAWEELHLRGAAGHGDAVLRLAQQAEFRRQFLGLRAPDLIGDDIAVALRVAAGRADIPALLRLLLARVELSQRGRALDDVDVPGTLLAAGLRREAIAYAGEQARRVPLAHAYGLAAALGEAGDPAGRVLFDAVDHEGFVDRKRTPVSGKQDAAAVAWARAAVRFRPLPSVLAAVDRAGEGDGRDDRPRPAERRRTAQAMRLAVVEALADAGDTDGLSRLWELLLERTPPIGPALAAETDGAGDPDGTDEEEEEAAEWTAELSEALVRVCRALALRGDAAQRRRLVARLTHAVRGRPMFSTSALAAAELFVDAEDFASAERLVERIGLEGAITTGDLSSGRSDNPIEDRLSYWRLRHILAGRDDAPVPTSVPPDPATPAGNGIAVEAFAHTDAVAIALAKRIDKVVGDLARIDGASALGRPVPLHEAWSLLVPVFALCKDPRRHTSATHHSIRQHRLPLLVGAVRVAERYGTGLLRLVADHLDKLVEAEPADWPPYVGLPLAARLRTAGFSAPWYPSALVEMEREAATEDVYSRLQSVTELVRRHAADGNTDDARRLALSLVDAAFGVGYRKDYQFDEWVDWLGHALAGEAGERWIGDAAWLARLLVDAAVRSEGAPGQAAASLPAAVAAVRPVVAVRLFEFLVAQGTVSHTRALSELLAALLAHVDDPNGVRLAGDLVTGVLAPSSVDARPEAASAFAAACRRLLPGLDVAAAIAAVSATVEHVALRSSRRAWREGFGLPVPAEVPSGDSPSDYGSFKSADGALIAPDDVPALAGTVNDIRALRRTEAPDSTFRWQAVLGRRDLSPAETDELVELFDDGSHRGGQALAALAERADAADRPEQAAAVARRALAATDGRGWAAGWDGGGRRRAAAVLARAGGKAGRVEAALDLAAEADASDWLAAMLVGELWDIVTALDPDSDPQTTWPEVREYLNGMAGSIDLPGDDPTALGDPRWWLPTAAAGDAPPRAGTHLDALIELAVRHLAHPAWAVQEGAVRATARALANRTAGCADAVARLVADPGCPDEILEAAGRAFAAARRQGLDGESASLLDDRLGRHESRVLRDLASSRTRQQRPLPPVYRLSVPPETPDVPGAAAPMLEPHIGQYALLADLGGVERRTVQAVAARRAVELLRTAPAVEDLQAALQGAEMMLSYPSPEVWASRGAFGRVLAEFDDAGLLDDAPHWALTRLRTVDLTLLDAVPSPRPASVPEPPPAGHDQRLDRWTADLPARLREHVDALDRPADGWRLFAGTSRLTVLNWGDLEEEAVWGTVASPSGDNDGLGTVRGWTLDDLSRPARPRLPPAGEPLAVANSGWTLHQWAADWVGLRPDVAAALGWTPDDASPGFWWTGSGAPAMERVWWTDGAWGRHAKAFDDTAAEGWAVLISTEAAAELAAALGPLTTQVSVTRSGPQRADGSTVRAAVETLWP